jgi:hypothetical protein
MDTDFAANWLAAGYAEARPVAGTSAGKMGKDGDLERKSRIFR